LLKATLVYWDRSFDPEAVKHRFSSMLRIVAIKMRDKTPLNIPEYFYAEQRYQATSRYPRLGGQGLVVPGSFLSDLDEAFCNLVLRVPFQFNSELRNLLASRDSARRRILTKQNRHVRKLYRFLNVRRKVAA
jgi:hypothetical protein